jgi:ubiquitin-protein ligase E3 C
MNQRIAITASDVVSFYRDILYEVYWTKPVLADDVEMTNPRGRLILSGTKLWNILYERWNRLQQVFCDEENWWFPHLSSIGHDRAVVTISERIEDDDNDDAGSDADSDDDDESDDEMAVDGQGIRSRPNNDTSKAEAESDALAGTFRDPKMARVLTSIPQALPFDRRLKLFNSLIRNDKQKALQAASSRRAMMAMAGQMDDDPLTFFDGGARERVTIRRADLYADSMQQLNGLGARLKNQIQVTFVNQHGTEEAGIDGGGVFKEFLDDLIKDAFLPDPKNNADDDDEDNIIKNATPQLFVETPVQTLTVNLSLPSRDARILAHYSFLGRVLGKAVYESILVEPQFALPFLNQCLGKTNSIEDLKNYDEEYYSNLSKLRRFSKEELEISGLTFELTFGGSSGSKPRTVELEPGGRSKAVTQKNAFKYTNLVANELLNKQGAEQTKAFLSGFRDLIPVSWVRLFSCTELQKLISGDDTIRGIDVPGLKKSMSYLGGYHESQPYIQAFWDILENDFTPEQQRKFLRFMTSCSRQPLLGFSSLEPPPSIQQIRLREDDRTKNSRLPTSQTCMNLLKLPNYDDRDLLKEKLIAAVEAGAGFELT